MTSVTAAVLDGTAEVDPCARPEGCVVVLPDLSGGMGSVVTAPFWTDRGIATDLAQRVPSNT